MLPFSSSPGTIDTPQSGAVDICSGQWIKVAHRRGHGQACAGFLGGVGGNQATVQSKVERDREFSRLPTRATTGRYSGCILVSGRQWFADMKNSWQCDQRL